MNEAMGLASMNPMVGGNKGNMIVNSLSNDKDITRTSMLLGKMYYKTKEIGNENE